MKPLELLQELVSIPSESGREDEVVHRLAAVMVELGLTPQVKGRNLTALIDGGPGPLLLLNSHTDTVPLGEGWNYGQATLQNGRLYGRGSNDAKGCVVSMLLGAVAAGKSLKGKVMLAFTCEEEVLGKGLETLLPEIPKPDAAVVGEPTGLSPAVAQKGLLVLEIHAKGRSAHAAHGGGENAVIAAAEDALALSKLTFPETHPVLGKTSLHVTQISGGARHNVIPDLCKLVVDIRTTPALPPAEIIARVKKAIKSDVVVRSNRLSAVETDSAHAIVQAAMTANPASAPYGSPTLSDWVFLKGIPTVKAGPGDSKRSHTPDEYLEVGELEAGVAFYENLIRSYFK